MRKIRVMIVDDSVVIRRLLTDILAQDAEIEVVGTAPNGRIALAKLPLLSPDLVTLDIEMPDLDGLQTLPLLRKDYPKLPVIMFSTLSQRGATATLDALALGATDYVAKPANVGSVSAGMQSVQQELIPKIKALFPQLQPASPPQPARPRSAITPPTIASNSTPRRKDVVVIGSSTGGPQALAAVLSNLPANFPVPVVVVQHMPPIFTQHLAERLDQCSPLTVTEVHDGESLRAGHAYVAPGDFHLEVARNGASVCTKLHQAPPENYCRPAVDVLFRSAAKVYGASCLAVVLTGMGKDGLRGAEDIVRAGGTLIAQDEATSVVYGMPRAVAEAGLASRVLALDAIADGLIQQTALARKVFALAN